VVTNADVVTLLHKAEVLVRAGRVQDAVHLLSSVPSVYNAIVNGVANALRSYPGGAVVDINGNVWATKDLIHRVMAGDWSAPPLANFLLSEIHMVLSQMR